MSHFTISGSLFCPSKFGSRRAAGALGTRCEKWLSRPQSWCYRNMARRNNRRNAYAFGDKPEIEFRRLQTYSQERACPDRLSECLELLREELKTKPGASTCPEVRMGRIRMIASVRGAMCVHNLRFGAIVDHLRHKSTAAPRSL